jgi:hypothetical protein
LLAAISSRRFPQALHLTQPGDLWAMLAAIPAGLSIILRPRPDLTEAVIASLLGYAPELAL